MATERRRAERVRPVARTPRRVRTVISISSWSRRRLELERYPKPRQRQFMEVAAVPRLPVGGRPQDRDQSTRVVDDNHHAGGAFGPHPGRPRRVRRCRCNHDPRVSRQGGPDDLDRTAPCDVEADEGARAARAWLPWSPLVEGTTENAIAEKHDFVLARGREARKVLDCRPSARRRE